MHIIDVLGNNSNIKKDDYHSFLQGLEEAGGQNIEYIKVVHPDPANPSRSANADLYLCEINNDNVIAIKRCFNNREWVQREKTVADLRLKFGMSHYGVSLREGLNLRREIEGTNLPPLDSWAPSHFVFIDFGKKGTRKNLRTLTVSEIINLESFFKQYGEWCSFNYVIGAKDRHPGNYVYDIVAGILYSIDNEEVPYDRNRNFADPNNQNDVFRQTIQKFIPSPGVRDTLVRKFGEGFIEKWGYIKSESSSLDGTGLDFTYIKTRLALDDPLRVLTSINL